MLKLCVFVAIFAFAVAVPAPEAKADPKTSPDPSLIAAAYTSPVVAAPVVYTDAYSAPLVFESYVSPSVFPADYSVFSPYTGSYIVL